MSQQIAKKLSNSEVDHSGRLAELAEKVLAECRRRGASQAEVGLNEESGLSVNVRLGDVETIEYTRDRGLSLTVYFGKQRGSASTADLDPESIDITVDQACAIARYTQPDDCAGLAEAELMATEFRDFDVWHPNAIDADAAVALAVEAESAGRELDPRIKNSDGASVNAGQGFSLYANSHGFLGHERATSYSVSCSLIAGEGEGMQRDYWYDGGCRLDLLQSARDIGRTAAERALARLQPRSLPTGRYPVLFAAEMARSLIGHLCSAASGSALYRQASFLLDHLGQPVLPAGISLIERPHKMRGHRSAAFDNEGVATYDNPLVEDGVLQRYILSSYSARKLGLKTTANAGGLHNLEVSCGAKSREELVREMGRGVLITELMGQGVNTVTGDYSRGAAGFWVENGEIQYPVDELTIAGNLKSILMQIVEIGADIDTRSSTSVGSILIESMTVAGS
ncbi:metalloprotease PmbA [Pseudomarimonas arenosa]|uniref:Metalloprotease PmbA n=1 Tax=Pseudomarimonas arenosa TaxID=2774145 RepID=A0AAW3ZN89_9GAMM|nr:metalloprotease PmbA [Pseudomarimonas arenosa]MBD8526999.1 metalloprotease PmbA [Pseudomarimonas arenosa]